MNTYKKVALDLLNAGYSPIPGKYGTKQPAIKEWTKYCIRKPTEEEVLHWGNTFDEANIDLAMGEASGVIALDFDSTDPKVIELIEHMMPDSPVERIGSKGWVRFFRFMGEHSFALKHNGEVVFEILSNNKKVTIPPSRHPSGKDYTWKHNSLLDINKNDLPLLPIGLIAAVQNKLKTAFPGTELNSSIKSINGRNDSLSSECGKIIAAGTPVNEAIQQLITFDKENNDPPLFSDEAEFRHTEPFSNALAFYANHLQSVNTKRFRDHKEYEIPITASAINETYVEEILKKKEQRPENQKSLKVPELPTKLPGALGMIYNHILNNSYVPQPAFALSAALGIMGALCGRKTQFQGVASNLYLLNLASSGSGKDMPMQIVKNMLSNINAHYLLGAGDYVSDASLMDELATNPVRIDVIDEASGLLKNVTSASNGYNGKMADILCELYTTATDTFLGRMTAEGRKGMCDRPCVLVMGATTPTGFKGAVNRAALEKGLLGRFIIFFGDSKQPARRVEEPEPISEELKSYLLFWKGWEPPSSADIKLGGTEQKVYRLGCTPDANLMLNVWFKEVDSDRIELPEESPYLPIVSRLYQQTLKLALISACSRINTGKPEVDVEDVKFAIQVMKYYKYHMRDVVDNNIFSNETEAKYVKVLLLIQKAKPMITQQVLNEKTRWLKPKERESIMRELLTDGKVIAFHHKDDLSQKTHIAYTAVESV